MTGPARLKLSWRVGLPISRSDFQFEALRELMRTHRKVVDEVALFETVTHHLYVPMEAVRATADLLARRMAALRSDGVASVGINVLTTIGHVNEGWDELPPLPFPPMVGHDGVESRSCACPNSPAMRRYVVEKYARFAGAAPDFIWVDDDIRMQHHGVEFACFCPDCLAALSRTIGRRFTRESLVRALNRPDGGSLRRAWVAQGGRSLAALMSAVARSIRRVNPRIRTGLMTSGILWNSNWGADFPGLLRRLGATKVRPGGGFYTDERPIDMLHKALECGRQCAGLPKAVTDVQYELENFPYAPLGKSRQALVAECTLALATGCNGIAFNMLGVGNVHRQAFDEKAPMLRRIEAALPFWQELTARTAGCAPAGYRPAWHPQMAARRAVHKGEDWLRSCPEYGIGAPNVFARLGIPLSPAREGGGVILHGRHAEVFSKAELRAMLAGPLLMDAFALDVLWKRGLGTLTGVRLAGWQDNGLAERLTDDPLNGALTGGLRDIRAEFWGDRMMTSAKLDPLKPEVRVLSVLETYLGERREPCVTAFENALGGRVVVFGHAPWRFVEVKRDQIVNAVDWAMRSRLPVRIRENVPVIPLVRLAPDRRRGVIVLVNAGLDPLARVSLAVRAPAANVRLASPGRKPVALRCREEPGGWSVELRDLEPWQTVALWFQSREMAG